MAYRKSFGSGFGEAFGGGYSSFSTQVDAGLGLVFRLNRLWEKADNYALDGELDKWNFVLDRIFCNLCYRNQMMITLDDKNRLVEIKLTEKDEMVFRKFQEDIKIIKAKKSQALKLKNNVSYNSLHDDHYNMLLLKDVWLRKFMNDLGLYLKEAERNPATAMFGGG